jgi:hypothetical protein
MPLRSLRKEFGVAIGASNPAVRVNTDEIPDALAVLTEVCRKHQWELRVWDETVGTQWYNGDEPRRPAGVRAGGPEGLSQAGPASALAELLNFWREPAKADDAEPGEVQPVVLVLKNFHLGFERARGPLVSIIQHLATDKIRDLPGYEQNKAEYDRRRIAGDSDTGKFVVGLMPAEARLPPEVAPLFKVIDHELPDEEELGKILDGVVPPDTEDTEDAPAERARVCKFALGLTRLQAEGVFAARHRPGRPGRPEYVWQEKSRILNKEGLVELHQGKETFADVAGLDGPRTS